MRFMIPAAFFGTFAACFFQILRLRMSLPETLRYVYNHASDEVIRRGKKIFHNAGVQLLDHDALTEYIAFRVRNDNYNNHYKVTIHQYLHPKELSLRCQCPYNMGSMCRHETAALFQLNDLLHTGFFNDTQITYQQQHTTVRMRQISEHYLRLFSSQDIMKQAEEWATYQGVELLSAKDDAVTALVHTGADNSFQVKLVQNEDRYFDTSCSCAETRYPLCVHKVAAFLHVLYKHGAHYFSTLRNWDAQKNKLLALYGYSLDQDIKGKFEFSYHEGKPFLRVLDKSIKKLSSQTQLKENSPEPLRLFDDISQLGVLIRHNGRSFPYVNFDLIAGQPNDAKTAMVGNITWLNLHEMVPTAGLEFREKILLSALRKQSEQELIRWLKKNLPFGDFMDNIQDQLSGNNITPELRQQVWEFYHPRYKQLLTQYREFPFVYYLPEGKACITENMQQQRFSEQPFSVHLKVASAPEGVCIEAKIALGDDLFPFENIIRLNDALVLIDGHFHAAEQIDMVQVLSRFPHDGILQISNADWPAFLEQELMPWSSVIQVDFDENLVENIAEKEPELRVYLRETDKMLSFKPIFSYEGLEKEWLDPSPAIIPVNGKVNIFHRNEAAEQTFLTLLRHLHPLMYESRKSRSFLLPSAEALKGGWYFSFMEKLQEAQVKILGYESLRQMRINPNRPLTRLNFGTGIDWFDAEMEVIFGDQHASVEEVKKALRKKENFVTLQDGSVGLLPEDWMEKYGLLVKLAKVKGNNLQLKKIHFSALEQLADEIDNSAVLQELEDKRRRLLNYDFNTASQVPLPENVHAELRPYQLGGFQWMNFLNDTSWGGILADDMGLGKTLQALSILQYCKNEKKQVKFLVVCPTTLMYNWENEIKKFTPDISYHIYHGSARMHEQDHFRLADVIITTYGTLRSDIKMLSQIQFDYVVLDESQAIKNPLSQVAKAAMLLQARNRLALSGTPVQNNTFDLYSQMNFLNPGMLGTADFFREEFATPIDKMQDKEAQNQLRKLVYPFLLRRTKEQVAPDLPEKSEMVLFCEMGSKQRKIYDAFRNRYRSKILGEIEEKGMDNARLSILTGLMKLRQICDSPAILNEAEIYDNHSVKIDELLRELTENTGSHKALVFSQFLGMLSLIREELEKRNIPFVYFDGSSTTQERENAIQQFQNDETCRVFLISLKAGGVGLNLTAADYVYIVDPWWNPAVEQQAIDRTHRIGQTKRIFAYRLICKDTIEEKILLLQERKINLVKGLIADENAFLKKLTKEDVDYLLS